MCRQEIVGLHLLLGDKHGLSVLEINLLVPELFFLILAHPVYKM